jgi:DNA replication protein DnaC
VPYCLLVGGLKVSLIKQLDLDPPSFFADAILDRLVHGAIKLELKGESMRKKLNSLTEADHTS